MKKIALILIILCTSINAENKAGPIQCMKSYEIIKTIMRIRVEYPPTYEGKLKLWDDYENS